MRRSANEDGAALVLALVVVIIAAVLGLAVANLTTNTLSFTNAAASDRQVSYAADGAVDWAINQVTQAPNTSAPVPCLSPEQFPGYPTPLMVSCETPAGGDRDGNGGSAGAQVTYMFKVTDAAAQLTYVNATVGFAPGDDGHLHAAVRSWVERPTT